jgi:hypothetical protein
MGAFDGIATFGGGVQESLEDLIVRKMAQARLANDTRRVDIEAERVAGDAEWRREQQRQLADVRDQQRKASAVTSADRLAKGLRIGTELDPGAVSTLQAGDLGSSVKAPTLSGTNYSGVLRMAVAGKPSPTQAQSTASEGQLRTTANPGKGPTWQGTPDQQAELEQRNARARMAATTTNPNLRSFLEAEDAGVKLPTELVKGSEHSAPYKEWQDYKSTGGTLSFDAYMTQDANRKRPTVNVNTGTNTALKLADDYRLESKDFTTMNQAMRRVVASATNPSAAGDMALLYSYMKILDPGSVVRESEFATAAQSGSLPQQIQGAATKLLSGQRLTPEQRTDFVNRARALYTEADNSNKAVRESYTQRAKKFNVDPSLIFTDLGAPEPAGGAGPKAGDVKTFPNGAKAVHDGTGWVRQ